MSEPRHSSNKALTRPMMLSLTIEAMQMPPGSAIESSSNVDAVAINVAAAEPHIAEVYSDPQDNFRERGIGVVGCGLLQR
jgi:hypothetical protein